jgi:hypothetical protein
MIFRYKGSMPAEITHKNEPRSININFRTLLNTVQILLMESVSLTLRGTLYFIESKMYEPDVKLFART